MRAAIFGATSMLILTTGLPSAQAIHWYRNEGSGCSAADGALTDDPEGTEPAVAATVVVGHNTFSEGIFGFGVEPLLPTTTTIKVGESITWTWNSAHCHSVTSTAFASGTTRVFDSGFHYPTTPPEGPPGVPGGAFEYPMLDETPTLSFTHTFAEAGNYPYFCVHHSSILMNSVVIVEP